MKKIFFLIICTILCFTQCSMRNKQNYEVCKANCNVDCGSCDSNIFSCKHDCYKKFCRVECFDRHNRSCKSCLERAQNRNERANCLDSEACTKRHDCLNECDFIYKVSTGNSTLPNHPELVEGCSECLCFNNVTNEFLGKVNSKRNHACLECNSNCKDAYKKFDRVDGVRGVCKTNE